MVNGIISDAEGSDLTLALENIKQNSSVSPPNMTHSIANIFNLPIELKQNIALRFSAQDYASFRESCLTMSQDIDGFSVLNNKIKLGTCSYEYEKKIKKILLSQSVRMVMKSHEKDFINEVLESILINKSRLPNGSLFMSTVFSTREMECVPSEEVDISNHYPQWVKKGFMIFKNEISNIIENPEMITFQRKNNPFISWVVGVKFKNEFICYSQLKTTFIKLSHIFNQVNGAEKLLIAVIADELKSFWCENIPHGLVKNDIAESAREAESLFAVAAEVRRTLQENIH